MRIAILTSSYRDFLYELYLNTPDLADESYSGQLKARNESLFGFADFYSRGFHAHGHEAKEFHFNNPWLQYSWAREHGLDVSPPAPPHAILKSSPSFARRILVRAKPFLRPLAKPFLRHRLPKWETDVLRAQIESFQPDIILNQEPASIRSGFLKSVKAPRRHIIGQIASALPIGEDYSAYDAMISSLPNLVHGFRKRGVPAAFNKLAFERRVLEVVPTTLKREIPLSFVGNLSRQHSGRIAFLEHVARRTELKVWGGGIERLPSSSPLHECFQGEAWGRMMYEVLGRSAITLNNHIDLAEVWANNLRLYEATGMGALLLTDAKRNLDEIFEPNKEIVTYDTPDDCVAQIMRLQVDEALRASIAATGQSRTLEMHNYIVRTGEMLEILRQVVSGDARRHWLAAA